MPDIPELPPQASLQFLAEGAANIVYRLHIPPSSPSIAAEVTPEIDTHSDATDPSPSEIDPLPYDPIFNGKLLRLRKQLPSTVSNEESFQRFQDVIRPLFPAENLVEQFLVRLPTDKVADCNKQLRLDEGAGRRHSKRRGVYLALEEHYGTLITDMTPDKAAGERLVEFKPKWLAQSPSAPPGSRRCRTCALRARNNAQKRHPDEHVSASFCPLDLASRDTSRVEKAVTVICHSSQYSQIDTEDIRNRIVEFLYKNPILQRLKQLQQELDPIGVLEGDVKSQGFLTAMTLRDCTVFLKVADVSNRDARVTCEADVLRQISEDKRQPVEARLGDLDLKSAAGNKAEYWKGLEKSLIEDGWYTAADSESCDLSES